MRIQTLAIAAALLAAGGSAVAGPCYVVYDRNDAVIYRDNKPPFDLSDPNSPARDMLRRQGQHLLVAEFVEECNPVGFISATTGANTVSVEDIVKQVRPAIGSSGAISGTTKAPVGP